MAAPDNPAPPGPVLVGVDGSSGAERAVRLAVGLASRTDRPLVILYGWSHDRPDTLETFETHAEKVLSAAVATAEELAPGLEVTTEAHPVDAAQALIEASRDASLLVVGSRGMGGFRGIMLGSVSQRCAHHAHCPIVIVPPPSTPAEGVGCDPG
ncbi:MAG TPA: universal stress protein [Acidimicrobiales bacterium]|nr:universal stress protein [Acidimicrobiales bacterium]